MKHLVFCAIAIILLIGIIILDNAVWRCVGYGCEK